MTITDSRLKSILLSGAALGTLAMPASAFAQDAAQDAETADSNVIIVTASKRETTLQEIPIAVSVTSGEDIEDAQVRDLIDLQTLVPSLRVSQLQSSANTNFIIRGFGNGANNPGIEPSVGVFIDGVYRSRSAAQIGDLPNIQRVEVLRGPQSTLFGKNASAGIISIVTDRPQFEFGGQVEATYGNFNARILRGDITGPISDTLAFSLAGNINKRDGYARDLNLNQKFNNRDRWGVRGQLLWEPSADLSFRVIGDYDKINENCCIAANVRENPGITAALRAASGQARPLEAADPFSYAVRNNFPSTNVIENYGGSLQGDWNVGALTFTSITAYREVRSTTNQDSDFTSADLIGQNAANTSIDTFTQELRVASDFDGPLNFLLGGFYFNENIDFTNSLLFGRDFRGYASALIGAGTGGQLSAPILEGLLGVPQNTFFRQGQGIFDDFTYGNDAYSIFGQVDFKPIDRLTFTFGFNYTEDKKRVTSNVVSTDAFSNLDLVAIGFAQALAGRGVDARNPAAVGAFAQANPAVFAAIQAGAQNPATNGLLALRGLQFLPPFLNYPNAVESGRTKDDDFSYTIRANYEITDNVNIYATYATGFKATSFNLSRDSRPFPTDFIPGSPVTNPAASPIRNAGLAVPNLTTGSRFAGPEESEVYEAGIKAQWPLVAFNLTVFKQSIRGFQSNVFTGTGFALANAGKQSTFGIEFDGTVRPTDGLNLFVAFTYLDPKYDSFLNSAVGDLTGATPAGIPALSASMGGSYTYEFEGGTKFTVRGDYAYESDVQIAEGLPGFIVTNPNGTRNFQPALDIARQFRRQTDLVNVSATLELTNGFEISAWARNLLDDRFISTVFDSVAQAGSISGYPSLPRTYGGSIRFKF
ncbi:TonB-dependent receptor-like protein [Blastomonas natatoria]|uniref:TonB-dependent receptor-like protein n=1 Tax=Blastomonas natatoria TaxID=34015 RepID=A0A2V3UQT4_9SPHN|nr:TonB-dependent receptor [Blastomonas natatoria]PXW69506.1 TonB-dependent receptor-like protein [Blastomonas natatoria]